MLVISVIPKHPLMGAKSVEQGLLLVGETPAAQKKPLMGAKSVEQSLLGFEGVLRSSGVLNQRLAYRNR